MEKCVIRRVVSIRALTRRATCVLVCPVYAGFVSIRALTRRATQTVWGAAAGWFGFQFVPSRGGQPHARCKISME